MKQSPFQSLGQKEVELVVDEPKPVAPGGEAPTRQVAELFEQLDDRTEVVYQPHTGLPQLGVDLIDLLAQTQRPPG
jgi:hypothetical protein